MKMASNKRWRPIFKNWISQQQVIGSSSNFKLKLRDQTHLKNAWNEGDFQLMEDALKILIIECLGNH